MARWALSFHRNHRDEEIAMPTASGHTKAILASKVQGTDVYNKAGESIGEVKDIVLDKTSNQIMYAVVGFGGFLGIGERYHPMPWASLDYDENMGGYVVALSRDVLEKAPAYEIDDLVRGDGQIRDSAQQYYSSYL
jgi:sporulation protein YlmC with PRC-barrel domain